MGCRHQGYGESSEMVWLYDGREANGWSRTMYTILSGMNGRFRMERKGVL